MTAAVESGQIPSMSIRRILLLSAALATLSAAPTFAAPGDKFSVAAGAANLRTGPNANDAVVIRLTQGAVVVELERSPGNGWVKVETTEGEKKSGWVALSTLQPLTNAALAASGEQSEAFQRFLPTLNQYNQDVLRTAGLLMFVEAREVDKGTISLRPSLAWLKLRDEHNPSAGRAFELWEAANGGPDKVPGLTLIITDQQGTNYMTLRREKGGQAPSTQTNPATGAARPAAPATGAAAPTGAVPGGAVTPAVPPPGGVVPRH